MAAEAGELSKGTQNYLKTFKGLGIVGGVTSSTISLSGAYNYYSNGGEGSTVAIKAGLDVVMSAVGIWGGPIGFGISATYFILDSTGVIDSWLE